MILSQGDRGSEVRKLQKALKAAGFNPGPIDGIYGPRTANAVSQYQAANDMASNGTAGNDLLVALGLAQNEEETDGEGGLGMSLAGDPQLWLVDGETWIVHTVPGTEDDPVYLAWKSPSDEDTQSFFGPGQEILYDQEITSNEWRSLGVLDFGSTDELRNMEDDPWTTWTETLRVESATQPWILDDDYQALMAMAVLEGRDLTASEIATTQWWQNHNATQRAWMSLYHSDPMTAEQMQADQRMLTGQALVDAGLGDSVPQDVVDYMADQVLMGNWSSTYMTQQIKALSDPASGYSIDSEVSSMLGDTQLQTTIDQKQEVRDMVNEWLGPNLGNWSDAEVSKWAGILRNDPNGADRLTETLQRQRMTLFPGYEDASLTYQDIASPWRQFVQSAWGEMPDETDDSFMRVLQMNDAVEAGTYLRQEGRRRGKQKVLKDTALEMLGTGNSTLRRAV